MSPIVRALLAYPWALRRPVLEALVELVDRHVRGVRLTPEEIEARVGHPVGVAPTRPTGRRQGTVQVIPVYGVLSQRGTMMTDVSTPGTSTEKVSQALQAALADPEIQAIVLDVDSPGGSVYGTPELAQRIFSARGQKPLVAVANSEAGSAAYWLASQASELVVTPSGEVGSIGVYAMHVDESKALEQAGLAVTYIAAGKYKIEGNPAQPLGTEALAAAQGRVDAYYQAFVRDVARGRGVSQQAVRTGMGEGRMVGAGPAVELGMADGMMTLEEVLGRLARGRKTVTRMGAADAAAELAARRERLRLLERC